MVHQLSNTEISLIEDSWGKALINPEETAGYFFEKLFELAPETQSMFGNDVNKQAEQFASLITFIVHKVDKLKYTADVIGLGVHHKEKGVSHAHLEKGRECLLFAMSKALGKEFDEATRNAWVKTYDILLITLSRPC